MFEVAGTVDFGVVAEVLEVGVCGVAVSAGLWWTQNPCCVAYTAF
jgi:hypothetical protein